MKTLIVGAVIGLASLSAYSASNNVLFAVTVKKDGVIIDSPKFLATVGQPASVRLPDGLAIEGVTSPPGTDGRVWTKVRITYFEGSDSRMVQEMSMRHTIEQGGSFDFTDPAQHRKFEILVRQAR